MRSICISCFNNKYKIETDCTTLKRFITWNAVNWVSLSLLRLLCSSSTLFHILTTFISSHSHTHTQTQKTYPSPRADVRWGHVEGVERLKRGGVQRQINSPLPLLCEGSACCTLPRSHSVCKHTRALLRDELLAYCKQSLFILCKCILIEKIMELRKQLSRLLSICYSSIKRLQSLNS